MIAIRSLRSALVILSGVLLFTAAGCPAASEEFDSEPVDDDVELEDDAPIDDDDVAMVPAFTYEGAEERIAFENALARDAFDEVRILARDARHAHLRGQADEAIDHLDDAVRELWAAEEECFQPVVLDRLRAVESAIDDVHERLHREHDPMSAFAALDAALAEHMP